MENLDPNHWYGVLAAAACGFGARYLPAVIGMGVGMVAAWVGACFIMLIDAGT